MTLEMIGCSLRRLGLYLVLVGIAAAAAHAIPWFPLGPFGGDARSFAADPSDSRHLYLGTANGWLYESHDAGVNWARVSQIGKRDDLVLDHMLVDPGNAKRLIVGAYRVDREDGGVYISQDSGKNWYEQAQMRGQSVRALARSISDPKLIVAGTLKGIYRSTDDGMHWDLISPPDSKEIHEVVSIAIDPIDPKIIYAGTWHLPWKTEDGGENWVNIKQGIIDDSDVFSIIVDPDRPKTVYVSACSGIYKSVDAAEQFRKIQGIPSTARRTRKLLQDPTNREIVYAGTTEGLYKTQDAGKTFARMTDPDIIINDVYVDPNNATHVLLATDRGGVLSSEDGGDSFHASNTGFSARLVSAFAASVQNPSLLYVGVANGKQAGGVFQSQDGGLKWLQQSTGLGGRDVFSLVSTTDGTLLAGTSHGVFRLQADSWTDSSDLIVPGATTEPTAPPIAILDKPQPPRAKPVAAAHAAVTIKASSHARASAARKIPLNTRKPHGKPVIRRVAQTSSSRTAKPQAKKPAPSAATHRLSVPAVPSPPRPPVRLDAIIYSMVAGKEGIYGGTEQGLIHSTDDGHSWDRVGSLAMADVHFVAMQQGFVLASGLKEMQLSSDGGATWSAVAVPAEITQIAAVGVDDVKNLWVGGAEGVFYSADRGASWKTLRSLYIRQVDGIYFDAPEHRVLVSSAASTFAFAVHVPDMKVSYWETGWPLRFVRPVGDHLIGATLFDGMVLQPQMVESPISASQ